MSPTQPPGRRLRLKGISTLTLSDSLADQLDRPDYRALPDLPLVVVQGPVRSGKSTLLGELDARWRPHAPVVRIALKGNADARPFEVAVAIADELVRRAPVPRRMFRRLFLGVAALNPTLPHDPVRAMRTLEDHLGRRDLVMTDVRRIVASARRVLSALPQNEVQPGAHAGLEAVVPLMWLLRRRLSAWRWFADATGANSGIAGLVELNRRHHAPDRHAEVDAVLLRAFLADLRRAFTRWRHSERLTRNVLLLIDGADTADAPLLFVRELLEARRAEAGRPGTGDPLLVVAACGVRTATGVAGFPWGRDVVGPSGPFAVDLSAHGSGAPAPVHVVDLGHNLPREPAPGDLVDRWSRSLSGGHGWAYARMSEHGRALPRGRAPDRETLFPLPLATELAEASLPVGASRELEQDLQILSAISPRDPRAGDAFLAVLAPPGKPGIAVRDALTRRGKAQELVSRELWTGPAADGLHPVFRRALLARLSEDRSPLSWDVVFERLAALHVEGAWHQQYLLARSGRALPAARYLARLLDDADPERWLAELTCITCAPRRRDEHTDFAAAWAAATDGGAEGRERHVTELVAALWLSRNHRGGPRHEEFLDAAHALEALTDTGLSRSLTEALFARAAELRTRQQFLDELV
jgi:hypothetical protein